MWTREECGAFFKNTFGVELSETELESIYTTLANNQLTPISRHGGNNVGFTPLEIQNLVHMALAQTGSTIDDSRFKKVKEEILPACTFALILKMLNYGEYIIVSSDVPDIILVNVASAKADLRHRADAIPIEVIFPTIVAIKTTPGANFTEKLARCVANKKFNKAYISHTTLLITVDARGENLNLENLSTLLLKQVRQPFHSIWIYAHTDAADLSKCVVAQITPDLHERIIDLTSELGSLLF